VDSGRVKREVLPHDPLSPFLIRECEANALAYPWHFHPEVELTLIRQGRGLRYVGDSIHPFEEGDLCLVGSGTSHCWLPEGAADQRFSFIVVQFGAEVFGRDFLELPPARPLKELLRRAVLGARVTGPTRDAVSHRLEAMLRTPLSPLERLGGLLEVLTKIATAPVDEIATLALTPGEPAKNLKQEPKQEQRVKRLINHIGQNATQNLPEKEVAALVDLSPAAFSRFFKRSFGKPFVRYVAEVRVAHACRLLAETERSIADVAFEVGFNNLANFNRRFRVLRNLTPSAYRSFARRVG
jgi:AraC-like DNA-binding protein